MRNIIKRDKLDQLLVADKCLCDQNGFLEVLSQKASLGHGKNTLSLAEVQQLIHLAQATGFRDWRSNVRRNEDGKLVFFDTENNSFAIGMYRGVKGVASALSV
ncbi:MAG: hypothetical protein AB7F19_02595 [Candidatus Babeliales bacterium]